MNVFGISIQGGSLKTILDRVLPENPGLSSWVVTANPEILLEARRNPDFAATLKQADYLCVDGFGLWLGLRLSGQPVQRVTGVELAEALIKQAAQRNLKVGLIGGAAGVADQVADYWKTRFPDLQTCAEAGGRIADDGTGDAQEEEAVHRLILEEPTILLVAFGGGRSTKQDNWISRRLEDLPSVNVIVGVGGTFDFWTGRIQRAPNLLRQVGLEWFWRLIQEPRRVPRIFRATVLFPIYFLIDQLKQAVPRRRLVYHFLLVVRTLFFLFILCPAMYRYLRLVFSQGVRAYAWSWADLIVPFVTLLVIYPVIRFFASLIDKRRAVE